MFGFEFHDGGATLFFEQAVNFDAHEILKDHGSRLHRRAVRNAVFTRGYSTGATRQSIHLTVGRDEAKVKTGTDYSGYVEVGTRKMEAQPYMGPALEETIPDFVADLEKGMTGK